MNGVWAHLIAEEGAWRVATTGTPITLPLTAVLNICHAGLKGLRKEDTVKRDPAVQAVILNGTLVEIADLEANRPEPGSRLAAWFPWDDASATVLRCSKLFILRP